ncbi:MAG: glycosyltransferase family 39 protein [Candidatus Riflebacteria bacterium]|nr:glycosyltransferase family 39 protein [Candidatus Riflebacteria bacterium]
MQDESSSKRILYFIIFIAFLFRYYGISDLAMWEDEIRTMLTSQISLANILTASKEYGEWHPPLYFLVTALWTKLFGFSEFSLRFPSLISGVLSVFLIFLLGRKLFDVKTGLFAALILTLSPFHIKYSQEARNYEFFSCLAILSTLYFFRKKDESSSRAAYIISTLAMLYSHTMSVFVLTGQYIIWFVMQKKKSSAVSFSDPQIDHQAESIQTFTKRDFYIVQAIILLAFFPVIFFLIKTSKHITIDSWLSMSDQIPSISDVFWCFFEFNGALSSCHASRDYDMTGGLLTIALLYSVALSAFFTSEKNEKVISESVKFCTILFCVAFFLPYFVSLFAGTSVFLPRSVIFASIAFYLVAAKGISNFSFSKSTTLFAALILIASAPALYEYYTNPTKDDWKSVSKSVSAKTNPNDLIVVCSHACKDSFKYYFPAKEQKIIGFPERTLAISEESLSELFPGILKNNAVWVITTYHSFGDVNLLIKKMQEYYKITGAEEFFGVQIFRFQRK